MRTRCHECGALVSPGRGCVDHFHAMLLLEQEALATKTDGTVGDDGLLAHFFAVSSYLLQHPQSMRLTAEALAATRQNIATILKAPNSLPYLRQQVRQMTNGPKRVLRRTGDSEIVWPVESWPMTVEDVLARGADGYRESVRNWAESIVRTLDSSEA